MTNEEFSIARSWVFGSGPAAEVALLAVVYTVVQMLARHSPPRSLSCRRHERLSHH